jgi:hypothetical protein
MTLWIAAAFLVVGFLALAKLLKLVENSGNVLAVSQRSLAIIRNAARVLAAFHEAAFIHRHIGRPLVRNWPKTSSVNWRNRVLCRRW